MTRDEALAILEMEDREEAIRIIRELAAKAEKYDQLCGQSTPLTPSGMKPVYSKPPAKKRRRKPGRKTGHHGCWRPGPLIIHDRQKHRLSCCPDCQQPLGTPVDEYKRYTEDIPPVEVKVTEHTVYRYWCKHCKRIVTAPVNAALPNSVLGLRLVVFTAWLHYLVGISVNNLVRFLSIFARVTVSAGGLTQAWKRLASLLTFRYDEIAEEIKGSAVLNGDETGWRLNGRTWWLWCFTTPKYCYYLITKGRGSPVLKKFFGNLFKGILICDFWAAYNKVTALAKQRCLYHLFSELVKVDKYNSAKEWKQFRKRLSRLLRDAIRLLDRKNELAETVYSRRKQRLYARLNLLIDEKYQEKNVKRLLKRLRRHSKELFTFLEFEGVSPYNNHAEQQKNISTKQVRTRSQNTGHSNDAFPNS